MNPLRRPRLYEVVALANAVAVVTAIRFFGRTELDLAASLSSVATFAAAVAAIVAAGVGLRIASVARADRARARLLLNRYLRPASLLDFGRLAVATAVVSYGYSWLKVFVPRLNPVLVDEALDQLDTAVHLGIGPNRLLLNLFPYPLLFRLVDVQYALFIFTLLAGIGWFLSTLSIRERARFASGLAFLWLVGSWWYLASPSLGPCFAFAGDYETVRPHMPLQSSLQRTLWRQYSTIKQEGERLYIEPAYGVAAMPSLHVAGQLFLAFWARRRAPRLAAFFGLMAALTFFGSLATGWHYAVDGYAGALLAFLAVKWGERWGRDAPAAATPPSRTGEA